MCVGGGVDNGTRDVCQSPVMGILTNAHVRWGDEGKKRETYQGLKESMLEGPQMKKTCHPEVQKVDKSETSLTPWIGNVPSAYGVILAAFFISSGLNVLICEIRAV